MSKVIAEKKNNINEWLNLKTTCGTSAVKSVFTISLTL